MFYYAFDEIKCGTRFSSLHVNMNPEKGKEGALYYVICGAGIRNALLELTIKNPEKKGGWMLYYVICEQEYGAAL